MVVSKTPKLIARKTMPDTSNDTGFPQETNGDRSMPTGEDLFQVFKSVAQNWLQLPCHSLGRPVEGPSVMSLERSVYLAGPIRGLVALRAHSRLGGVLLEKTEVLNHSLQTSDEAFRELVQLFCGHLLSSFWKIEGVSAIPSQPSKPQSWPKGKPQAAVALLLDQCPIEIRFWVETGKAL